MVRQCVVCRKLSGRPFKLPVEPPLPGARVADVPAFFHTGIDFAGPFNVKMMSESQKCYICLFTCSVSRGLHLEVTEDQSTESFMRAFRRFVSRRSLPKKVLTDNAATFKKASEYVSKKGVEWSFITKRAPWHGGFWERLVGIVKMVLKKVIGRALISFDEFRTVVSEAEAIVNDRPLTYSSTDINDEAPVTPSQLMCGHRLTTLPHDFITPEELEDPDFQIQKNEADVRARRLDEILTRFRSRWSKEYLTALREYNQRSGKEEQIKVGEVVIIHEETPRLKWKLGLVTELFYGPDRICRSVALKTANGFTNRAVSKLYPLELQASPDVKYTNIDVEDDRRTHAAEDG
ncbi:uncharacterized protein LOC141907098 [Tubulanus polymorphus]|uniref:uncharacterized protein LOC141907098 n=1 Tax=Tubulanus polymorphus TaxID=672921 RepID=UPI003DA33950